MKKGKMSCEEFQYEGLFEDNQISGKGVLVDQSNMSYEGEFKHGMFVNGSVLKKKPSGEVIFKYMGTINDNGSGFNNGMLTLTSGCKQKENQKEKKETKLEGTFKNGNLQGSSKFTFENGDTYEGGFDKGKR